jgi:ATP-dependent DNA ligase
LEQLGYRVQWFMDASHMRIASRIRQSKGDNNTYHYPLSDRLDTALICCKSYAKESI